MSLTLTERPMRDLNHHITSVKHDSRINKWVYAFRVGPATEEAAANTRLTARRIAYQRIIELLAAQIASNDAVAA